MRLPERGKTSFTKPKLNYIPATFNSCRFSFPLPTFFATFDQSHFPVLMRDIRIKAVWIIVLIAACSGCVTDSCDDPGESMAVITLYETDNDDTTVIDSLTVYGVGMDDLLIYNNTETGKIELPLNPASDYADYVIINGLIYDTLKITYTTTQHFISKACGYNFFYSIESISYTRNRIDTILIINNSVNPLDEENLRTFF